MSTTTVAHHEAHDEHPTGIKRWLTTTNHKDIGTMYLTFSLIMFLVGGSMILGIRAELFSLTAFVLNKRVNVLELEGHIIFRKAISFKRFRVEIGFFLIENVKRAVSGIAYLN